MGFIVQTLPSDWNIPLLHSFILLLLLGQVLLEPIVKGALVSLVRLEAMTMVAVVSLYGSFLELVLYCLFSLSASLLLFLFPSNSCPGQLPYYTIAQLSLAAILTS